MRAVLQRVSAARVTVQGVEVGAIGPGLLVYLGVGQNDTEQDARYLADKIADLRIFRARPLFLSSYFVLGYRQ